MPVQAVSSTIGSQGNAIITIYDDENYYEITPQQLGVDQIHSIEHQEFVDDLISSQTIYRFLFITSSGVLVIRIWEPSGRITVERVLQMMLNDFPIFSL